MGWCKRHSEAFFFIEGDGCFKCDDERDAEREAERQREQEERERLEPQRVEVNWVS